MAVADRASGAPRRSTSGGPRHLRDQWRFFEPQTVCGPPPTFFDDASDAAADDRSDLDDERPIDRWIVLADDRVDYLDHDRVDYDHFDYADDHHYHHDGAARSHHSGEPSARGGGEWQRTAQSRDNCGERAER